MAKALSVSHYYAYGMEISDLAQESGESTPYPRLRTTGKETEEQESLYWLDFGPRRYDAPLCRWSGPDPLAEEDYGTSPYAYCNGLPTALVDPSGLQAQCYRDDMDEYRRSGGSAGPVYDWSWGESGYYPDREGDMRWMSSDPRSNPAVSLGQVIGRGREWTTILNNKHSRDRFFSSIYKNAIVAYERKYDYFSVGIVTLYADGSVQGGFSVAGTPGNGANFEGENGCGFIGLFTDGSYKIVVHFSEYTKVGGGIYPIDNPYISSDYGDRNGNMHYGVDLINKQQGEVNGKPVYSVTSGKVVRLVTTPDGKKGGVRVRIQAPDGYQYNYFHLQTGSNKHLFLNMPINIGDIIGNVGNTGISRGAHLHFEIWSPNGIKVNPYGVYPILHNIPHR